MNNKSPNITTIEEIVDQLKIKRHEWVVRLIKFGEAKIPKAGFYVFDDPDTDAWLTQTLKDYGDAVRAEERKKAIKVIQKYQDTQIGRSTTMAYSSAHVDCTTGIIKALEANNE